MAGQPTNFKPGDIRGIDVSHFQGTVNWQKVAASNVVFAFAKATENIGFKDIRFTANYDGMKSNGILRGAYHFFRPKVDAKAQADNYLHVVKQLQPGDLPPVLDVETDDGKPASTIIKGIRTWIDQVEEALGRTPIIYTGAAFWKAKVAGTNEFAENPLWVAHYTSKPKPNVPTGFPRFTIWQFTSKGGGAVSGVSGQNLDLNRFNGTMVELRKLAGL